jgi:hypothetical protein
LHQGLLGSAAPRYADIVLFLEITMGVAGQLPNNATLDAAR